MSEETLAKSKLTFLHKALFLVILIIGVDIASFIIEPKIYLSENQILYLMSTSAQVMTGIFGIVLAAYAIIDPKLKSEAQSNEELEESLTIIREEYHNNIIVLSIFCAWTIISCLFTLACFEDISEFIVPMLLNQSSILCVGSIVLVLSFGCSILNPNSLSKLNSKALEKVNSEYKEENLKLEPYIEMYNNLKFLLTTYASELAVKDFDNSVIKYKDIKKRMRTNQALEILQMNKIIDQNLFKKIVEFQRYRNALVHSTGQDKVNIEIYKDLQETYKFLLAVYNNRHDDNTRKEKQKELADFGKDISVNKKEKAILDLINAKSNITLKELSNELAYTQVEIGRAHV